MARRTHPVKVSEESTDNTIVAKDILTTGEELSEVEDTSKQFISLKNILQAGTQLSRVVRGSPSTLERTEKTPAPEISSDFRILLYLTTNRYHIDRWRSRVVIKHGNTTILSTSYSSDNYARRKANILSQHTHWPIIES